MKLDKAHSGSTSPENTGDDSGKYPAWDAGPTQDSIDDLTARFQKLTIHDIEMEDWDLIDDLTARFQKLTILDIELEIFEGHEEKEAEEMETCG